MALTISCRIYTTPVDSTHISHAVLLVGYCRLLAGFLLSRRTEIAPEYYAFTNYNKINAYRNGFDADYVDSTTLKRSSLTSHMLTTLAALRTDANDLETQSLLDKIERHVRLGVNDSERIRQMLDNGLSQKQIIQRLCDELLQPVS